MLHELLSELPHLILGDHDWLLGWFLLLELEDWRRQELLKPLINILPLLNISLFPHNLWICLLASVPVQLEKCEFGFDFRLCQ